MLLLLFYKFMQTRVNPNITKNYCSKTKMLSLESLQATSSNHLESSSPRLSFSSEFLDENNFISICPDPMREIEETKIARELDFEFLSGNSTNMIAADELFSEGKLLPFRQTEIKLNKIAIKLDNAKVGPEEIEQINKEESRISWFLDDDPSPRPPKCTVLWKELLRLKKQRASTLSPPSSSSSSSSSRSSLAENSSADERKEGTRNKEKINKKMERTRKASIRLRPVINVPICTQSKNSVLPPLFPLRKGRLERCNN